MFEAKVELVRKREQFISKNYEWAHMWLEGKQELCHEGTCTWMNVFCHLSPFPTFSLLFFQCILLTEIFFLYIPAII